MAHTEITEGSREDLQRAVRKKQTQKAHNRKEQASVIKEAKILEGLYSHGVNQSIRKY
jgi:hypothetical protein